MVLEVVKEIWISQLHVVPKPGCLCPEGVHAGFVYVMGMASEVREFRGKVFELMEAEKCEIIDICDLEPLELWQEFGVLDKKQEELLEHVKKTGNTDCNSYSWYYEEDED